jgi:phosphoglycerate dehydrogenase-like enzyme
MPKIVVTNNQNFTPVQKQRLDSLGDVTYYDQLPASPEEYLERVKDADIICSGTAGLKDIYAQLKDVYITVAFVSVAFVDVEVLKKNGVTISNAPGSNRNAVSEWIMGMIIMMSRNFQELTNSKENPRDQSGLPPITPGLAGKNITVLGQGHIGKLVGKLASAFGMNVRFFKRGDDLAGSVKGADVVVDTLSSNPSTQKLLNKRFFESLKQGSRFVTVTRSEVVDEDAMLEALDSGKLAGVATDCSGILVGNTEDPYYQKLISHPKVYATPHIAYNTEMSRQMGADIMIDNVEAFVKGKPQNVVNP